MSVNDLRKVITHTVSGEDNFNLNRSFLLETEKP